MEKAMEPAERLKLIEALHRYSKPFIDVRESVSLTFRHEDGQALEVGRDRFIGQFSQGFIQTRKELAPVFNDKSKYKQMVGMKMPLRTDAYWVHFQAHKDGHFPFHPLTAGKRDDPVGYIVDAETGEITGEAHGRIRSGVLRYGWSGAIGVRAPEEVDAIMRRMDDRIRRAYDYNIG